MNSNKHPCSCCLCRNVITSNNLPIHYNSKQCKSGKLFSPALYKGIDCRHCGKTCKSNNSRAQHELYCSLAPEKKRRAPSYGMLGKKGGNQFTKAKELGLPVPVVTDETRKKISVHSKAIVWDEQRRKNHSEAMKRAVQENPESYTSSNRGRTKQIEYDGIKFQGQWELDFYKWAKSNNLDPKRPDRSFKYEWKGERCYYPDFYIESLDAYIEVKGYETDRDRAKWDQFPERLIIIKEQQIKEIRNGDFKGIDL